MSDTRWQPAGRAGFVLRACEAIKRVGPGAFLFSPGDIDQPDGNRRIIDRYFGPEFPWYIVVGNHEVENAEAMQWVRQWFAGIDVLV